jgi:GTPase
MEFIYRGEYIKTGNKLIFREGKIRGVGIIQEILE